MPRTLSVAVALLTFLAASPLWATGRSPAEGQEVMVVTAHPAATEAGLAMLRAGGNAIDAAVAATFVLAVVEPWSSGLGGGGFLLFHQALDQTTVALDFREQAPGAAERDMYLRGGVLRPELAREGWLSVGVPGAPAGLLQAHARWGTLPRAKVLAEARRLAWRGFPVSRAFREAVEGSLELLRRDPEAARTFLVPDPAGGPPVAPPVGHRLRQRDLARTLAALAYKGAEGFYGGPVARKLVAASEAGGGLLTADDLATYHPIERSPLRGTYRGYTIESMPPPSSGGVVLLQVLALLSRYDLSREGYHSPRTLHLLTEALRRAYADRNTLLGDPAFVKNPVERLTSQSLAEERWLSIDPLRATPSTRVRPEPAPEMDEGMETTHVSVVDAGGNAVSLTNTINYRFGAGVVAPGTGVLLNNEMDDFAAWPGEPNVYGLVQGEANAVAPRKIPLSSMTPTLVFKGEGPDRRLHLVLGAPGGPTIITTVLQVLLGVVHHEMDIAQAVGAPRIHHQWQPDVLWAEPYGLDALTVAGLSARGHRVVWRSPWGNAQCILVDPDTEVRYGAADPRGEGLAAGF